MNALKVLEDVDDLADAYVEKEFAGSNARDLDPQWQAAIKLVLRESFREGFRQGLKYAEENSAK